MKKLNALKMLLFVLLFINISCGKDELCVEKEQIRGDWIWVSSYGGEAGETLTPVNSMSTRRLEIGKSIYREYMNDSLILETTYTLATADEPIFSTTNTIMEFGDGGVVSVVVNESDLEIIEGCFDCYSHKYEKK